MADSEVKICNMGLANIGISQFIAALSGRTKEEIVCNLFYAECRDQVLQRIDWAFARAYATLALVEEDPNDDWDFAYRQPTNCLAARRIVTVNGLSEPNPPPFELGHDDSGILIYTDEPSAILRFTERVTDTTRFAPLFTAALSWKISSSVAMPLMAGSIGNQADAVRKGADKQYEIELLIAAAASGNESEPQDEPDPGLVRARE